MAAMMTRQIGQIPMAAPSKVPVRASTSGIFQRSSARTSVIASEIGQALYPGILRPLKASISQRIGSKAKINLMNITSRISFLFRTTSYTPNKSVLPIPLLPLMVGPILSFVKPICMNKSHDTLYFLCKTLKFILFF